VADILYSWTHQLLFISVRILSILPTRQAKFLEVSAESDSQYELKKSVWWVSLKSFELPVLLPYYT